DRVRPVELDYLVCKLLRGEYFWGLSLAAYVLQAQIQQTEQHGVLVGRCELPLVEKGQHLLREADRAAISHCCAIASMRRSGSTQRTPPRGSLASPAYRGIT